MMQGQLNKNETSKEFSVEGLGKLEESAEIDESKIHSINKKEILQELVKSEKDTVKKLKELVQKVKDILWIEGETGKTIVTRKGLDFSQQIKLQMVGAYFANELGLKSKKSLNIEELKSALSVEGRALSRPLGEFVKSHIISEDNGEYTIKYYLIEGIIDEIHSKNTKGIVFPKAITKRRKQMMQGQLNKNETSKEFSVEGLGKLEESAEIDESKIHNVFDFDKRNVRIIYPIANLDVSESIKQYKATLLYLTALKYCYGVSEISSGELRNNLEDMGLNKSLVNLSTNLKSFPQYIVHKKGPKGSTATSYKLTIPGEREAIKIIKELGGLE